MLQPISTLKGYGIEATDRRIGTVVDFLFDDKSWGVRWLVVDCGSWLLDRKVLIPPSDVSYISVEHKLMAVRMTKAQVEGAPSMLEHQPVSEQMLSRLNAYEEWDPLWGGSYLGGGMGGMNAPYPSYEDRAERRPEAATPREGDPQLRSVVEVIGYHIHATDGVMGHVQELMLDTDDWSLHYLVIDTSNWWFGKIVLIPPNVVTGIEWIERQIHVNVSRERVSASPPWNPLVALDDSYITDLDSHYGWPDSRG